MSKHLKLYLSEGERKDLKSITKRGKHAARTIKRARILLLADSGQENPSNYTEIMKAVGVCKATVSGIVRQCVLEGVGAALSEKPRAGREPQLTGEIEARLVTLVCSDAPEGYARWTVRLLAEQMVVMGYVEDISKSSVFNMLKKTNLNQRAISRAYHAVITGFATNDDQMLPAAEGSFGNKPAGAFLKRAVSL
jgi:transposase